jgi:hypothetical protein
MPTATESGASESNWHMAAIATEHLHFVLRRMSDDDWTRLKALMLERLTNSDRRAEVDVLERVFRKDEAVAAQAGGIVFRMIQAMTSDPLLRNEVRKAHEHLRSRVRMVLREMSDRDWSWFKDLMGRTLSQPARAEDLRVLELVFRIGESISNVEIAALAKADQVSGRRLIDPEVARRNALATVRLPGAAQIDPEAAFTAAKTAMESVKVTAERARHTLAYSFVEPTAPYKHARNTVFKLVDAIIEKQELMGVVTNLETDLAAMRPVSREKVRWSLHRMPLSDRMSLIRLIPLNTVLMFQEAQGDSNEQNPSLRAARDRRLAHDLFIQGQSDEELMAKFRCSLHALKSAVGAILDTLAGRPLARKLVNAYLARVEAIEPMRPDEVRRLMKRLTAEQRAEILNRIPPCAWKVRDVMPVHKRLFLDYLSGEWVLGPLVSHHNLQADERLSGTFKRAGTLTVRGAQAAIVGLLSKIADEPDLRQQLRHWVSVEFGCELPSAGAVAETEEAQLGDLMPTALVIV